MSSWETQQPIEQAAAKREAQQLQHKYEELLDLHASLIAAMFNQDTHEVMCLYRASLHDNLAIRSDVDQKLKKLVHVPPFAK